MAIFDAREGGESLAVCRIVAGATVASELAQTASSGAARALWVDERFGGMRALDEGWVRWIGGASPTVVTILLVLGLASSLALTIGFRTRLAAVATWLLFRTLTGLNDHAGGSVDDLLVNVLFLLMLSRCGRAWSLDARRDGAPPVGVPAWPRWLLVWQLVLMYGMTGLQKVSSGWVPGGSLDALWYILQQPTWQRFDMRWLAPAYPLLQVATLFTWLFEVSAPLLLLAVWFNATRDRQGRLRALFKRIDVRRLYLLAGLVLHLGIFLAMEVGPFLGAVLSLYACCIEPEEWRSILARVRRRADVVGFKPG